MRSPDPGAVTVNKTDVETPASKYLADPESEQPMIDADIDICLFFSSAPGCTKLAVRSSLASVRLWVLVMSNELQVSPLPVPSGWPCHSLAVVTNQPAHFNAESARHAFPPCSQVFAFSEANPARQTGSFQLMRISFFLLRGRLLSLTRLFVIERL